MKPRTFKILVSGIHYLRCNGEMAILIGLITHLGHRFPSAHFWIGSIDSEFDEIQLKRIFPKMHDRIHLIKVPALGGMHWVIRVLILFVRYIFVYPKCDLVIHLGTDGFRDDVLTSKLLSILSVASHNYQILLARLLRRPVIACSMTVGLFSNALTRSLSRFTLNKASFITAREGITLNYLKQIGVKSQIYPVADLAFLMEPAGTERVNSLLAGEGISPDERLVFVAPNPIHRQVRSPAGKKKTNGYITAMVDIIDYLYDKDLMVILIAQTTGDKHDDMPICKNIQERSKAKPVIIANTKYTPQEIKGIMRRCELGISGKLHASIFGLSSGVPTITVSSQQKIYGIIGEMLGLNELIVDFRASNLSALTTQLIELTDKCQLEKERLSQELAKKLPEIQRMAQQNIELVSSLIKELTFD